MISYIRKIITISLLLVTLLLAGCSGCSESGRRNKLKKYSSSKVEKSNIQKEKLSIPMESKDGVKYIPIEINGITLKFIFDTGASSICISTAEALVLVRQGTLEREDIIDVEYFQDATGNISEGTTINLRSVKIGDRVLKNVKATIIDNFEAPLLLGQSALEEFGKISIDNKRGVIIFE